MKEGKSVKHEGESSTKLKIKSNQESVQVDSMN